jgi:hypothetical protein
MRNLATAALLLSLVGCGEQVKETYSTYADADRAGAVERGWVPAFVPTSARDITDSHNLDTNRQTLWFTIPPSHVGAMVARPHVVSAEDKRAAAELSTKHGFGAASEVYVVCSEPLNGALAVDRESGRAVYDTTAEWPDDDCSQVR